MRDALHRYLLRLRGETDIASWEKTPPSGAEQSLESIADWGFAEDWTDWVNAAE